MDELSDDDAYQPWQVLTLDTETEVEFKGYDFDLDNEEPAIEALLRTSDTALADHESFLRVVLRVRNAEALDNLLRILWRCRRAFRKVRPDLIRVTHN